MKTLAVFGVVLLTAWGALAEDVISEARDPYVNRMVSITQTHEAGTNLYEIVGGAEPWEPVSVYVEKDGTNGTVSVNIQRLYDITQQVVGDVVTTNFFGNVVTNTSAQVTNLVTATVTVPLVLETGWTNSGLIAVSKSFVVKAGDFIEVIHSEDEVATVISGRR